VVITPTYSGCPAMGQIEDDVRAALAHRHRGRVVTQLAPAWTTDWMTDEAQGKAARLRHRAAAPAPRHSGSNVVRFMRRRATRRWPARMRLGQHGRVLALRLHRLQGAVQVPRLPGAVRLLQAVLSSRSQTPCQPPVFTNSHRQARQPRSRWLGGDHLRHPPAERERFAFQPGQFLTLRATIDGQDVRRNYSISSPRSRLRPQRRAGNRHPPGRRRPVLQLGRAQLIKAGDTLEVMPPDGRFVVKKPRALHRVGFAAGSGITPILSIAASTLEEQPESKFTLVYGNRRMSSVMFNEALQDLKDRYPTA
jgi:metal-sulfur cluster biosynthetic enzyme